MKITLFLNVLLRFTIAIYTQLVAVGSAGKRFKMGIFSILRFAIYLFLILVPGVVLAQFPYNEDFRTSTQRGDLVFGGSPEAFLTAGKKIDTGTDAEGEGYLRLTNNQTYQTGYVYSNNVFLGTYGLDIEFEYFTHGGGNDGGADGIGFFLFDATASPFRIGGYGGSLGYAQYDTTPGVSKGYLGIGIDEYGNYSTSGNSKSGGAGTGNDAGYRPNNITIRGAGNGSGAGNYPWLATTQTTNLPGTDDFNIAGKVRGATDGQPGYRKVFINLKPRPGGGLIINVRVKHDDVTSQIITNYQYTTPIPSGGLKYGIASSTGASVNYHEIRGLKITVDPNSVLKPMAVDDEDAICQGTSSSLDILANDTRPNSGGAPNPASVDLDATTPGVQQTVVKPEGTFTFNTTNNRLIFTPSAAFSSVATIQYTFMDIYGSPSSNQGTVTIKAVYPRINSQPVSKTVCENGSATFSVGVDRGADNGTIEYRWEYNLNTSAGWQTLNDGVVNGSTVSGSKTKDLLLSNISLLGHNSRYRVILKSTTAGCYATSNEASLKVNPNAVVDPVPSQVICRNRNTTAITFAGTNVTTYTWTNNRTEIGLAASGTGNISSFVARNTTTAPIVATITVTPTNNNNCPGTPETFTITVNPDVSIALTSMSADRSLCVNTVMENITYQVTNGTGATYALPPGLSGSFDPATNIVTISGTPTQVGRFTYSVTATGTCAAATLTGTITVRPNTTLTLSSNNATTQTPCVNTAITDIVYSATNETGITVDGLPPGLTSTYTAGEFRITGRPTQVGTFDFTVTATGACLPASATGRIVVRPNTTITPISTNQSQTVCVNRAVADIAFQVTDGNDATVTGLPPGISGTYDATTNIYTLKGIPTQAGSFSYTVTATGSCAAVTYTNTLTVNPDVTLVLGSSNNNQTVCINTGIQDITYTAANETNIVVSGLPSGVTGIYTANAFKISGRPTEIGSFDYTITATGTCEQALATGTLIVNPDVTIALTSTNDDQIVCINRAVANITYQITNGSNATATGLPPGVTGSYNTTTNIFTISGVPTQAGEFNFQVTATGNCAPAMLAGKITVNPDVSIDPAPDNADQTICVNNGLNDIVFTTANATGATVSGLPNGVTGIFVNGTVRISGVPSLAGRFPYTITVTGNCVSATATGVLTVNPDVTIALSSANNNQDLCINRPLVNITFNVANGTAVAVTGLPDGVTGNYNATSRIYTISGTPTQFGVFNYSVTASGLCQPAIAQGTLTVKPDVTIVLNSANQAQTVCINRAIQNIVYTTAYERNVTVVGLPAGLRGDYTNGSFVISGTPTEDGSFPYTVTAIGECAPATAAGVITVNPDATIALSSGNDNQNICINTAVANITFNVTNSTSVSATDLPDGLSGIYNPATKIFTISGTATKAGTFNYTVTASGTCAPAIATGTIIVKPDVILVLNSGNQNQTVCINKGIQNIVYTATNQTGVIVSGLPVGTTGSYNNGTFVISGIPTEAGAFTYTVTASGDCAPAIATGVITVTPDATIALSSANNDQNICVNTAITNITFNVTNSSAVTVSGLPNGVTGNYDANTKIFTISGSARLAGTFGYTVTASGACEPALATGTIIVKPDVNMVLNSANQLQTVCINTAVQNIVYTLTNETSVTVSGLPSGVTGRYTTGSFVISGIPTQSGPFTYTVTATGACAPVTMTGVLTVNPDVTIALTTANNEQTICINRAVAAISYTLTNSTGATVTGLPSGVTGTYSNGIFAISGTATQSGTFNYTVTGTGSCRSASLSGTIIVNPDVAIQLTSANENQTVCINRAFQNITYTVANATNVTVTGLPAGVTGNYVNSTFVISGTPTLAGSFPYIVTASGNCISATANGTLTVNPDVALVLSSTDKDQTLCINTVLTDIRYTATNATAGTVTGLPTGLTGTFSNGEFTISGSPTQAGEFTYTVTATGLCVPKTLTGMINVNPDVAIVPNTTTSSQTLCVNTPIQTINFILANATNATVTALPNGVSGTYSNGSFVISGTPAQSGIFNYTITATGTCASATATGTLTVNPDVTLVLSSADQNQELCINTVLTNITYTATHATAVEVTGLPAGLTGTFANGTVTISGTPTESGLFTYTISATGLCLPKTLTGKIRVNPDVVITPNTSTSIQIVCINTPIQSVNFSLANASGATVTNLPQGITGIYSNGAFVISGTPTESGVFNYTITATGTCVSATATGTLTVNPDVTLVLSSADKDQTLCVNTALTNITYTATNATAATVTGLPAGLTGSFTAGVFTISGTPTEYGTFPYTVTATGLCTPASLSGTIRVNRDVVITPNTTTSTQVVCINTPIQSITFSLADATGATVLNLPQGVTGTYSNGSFVISGRPTQSGVYNYTVTATGLCVSATASGTITVNPDVTLVLSSADKDQTLCVNTTLTNITYAATNATSVVVTGLPTGLTGDFANGTLTISGTPTQSGTFNYTVTANGLCVPKILTGTIFVNPDVSISTTSTVSQTLCINTPVQNIIFSLANATGATVTNLPSGLTGSYSNGSFVISGTPTQSGVFNYTVTATGLCAAATATGTLTINPDVTLVLNSASKDQTLCVNTALSNIIYTATNATAATVTGLPNGLTGSYAAGVITISGTPTEYGSFTYTVTATGLCTPASLSGTIMVNPDVIIAPNTTTSFQTICINTPVQSINFNLANATNATVSGLPPGVTGVYNSGTFVITGTPTQAGVFNYTVTATGACVSATATGTLIVNPDVSLLLSSGSQDQTLCINTVLTNITYTAANATTATVTGLPNGLTGSFANGIFTISGTPTEAGRFNYTVTATGLCRSASLGGIIIVNPDVNISTTSALSPTLCINTALPNITLSLANATSATVSGLPRGVTGTYTTGTFVISGRPTEPGVFAYTVTATGACAAATVSGIITVNPDVKLELSSSSKDQMLCINTALQNITYTVTNASTAAITGLPRGLTGTFANGVFTITGIPTEAGTFSYTVTASGLCQPAVATGIIKVNPDVTLTLNAANSSQTICINTAVQNITYAAANATSVTASGLPPGVNGAFSNGVFVISGSATVAGTYNFTITATGTCAAASAAGQIIVTPNAALALSSAAGTNSQSVCLNLPLTTIQYTVTNATGAIVTGLPGGITGNYSNGIFTISGAATQSGTFNYTVTTTGGCASASLSGTIFVAPNAAIALSSAVGSNNQSICVNTAVAAIRYQVTNATGAVVTGLPAGLTGVYANGIFTINGTPLQPGTYNYSVSTTGGCTSASLSGTIQVNPDATISLSSAAATDNQTVCVSNAITTVTYSTTAATGAVVTGLPQGLTASYSSGNIQISGRPAQTGTFNYVVTASGNCKPVQISGSIIVHPVPAGYNDVVSNLSCENSGISYSLQDNINNTAKGGNGIASSFIWTIVPNTNIAGLTGGAGNTITATLKNLSHQLQQAVYVVTPTSVTGGCPGQAFTVTVNVPVCSNIIITKTADVSVVAQAGDRIRYTITVKNNGAANHTNVVVTDPYLGGTLTRTSGDNGNNILEADEIWVYGGVYTVVQADIDNNGKPASGSGKITNTATVNTAEHPELLSASADVSINSTGDVVLVKTGVMSRDFATITYTFKITNTGNVRLTNLRLIDTKFAGDITLNNTTLEVGASITATATYTVTDNEKRDGRVMNTATVNGSTPAGGTVSDVSGTQANNDEPTLHIIDDAPQAINDRAETMINNPVTFSITANDLPSFNGLDAGSVVITTYPRFGTLTVNMDGTVTYTPNRTFSGQDSFMYTVTDYRGKLSNRALVNITVTPIDLFIPNTFTPNGDGKNDTFKIVGKESFDSIELLIFNRWGNEVYRSKNYQDDWDGSGLNEGTYYYVITLKKGADQTAKKGWILLKR
jgi:gliding motility-associated-like protein